VAIGKPKAIDRHFDPMSTVVEDRVVLFRADNFDSAIKQAEVEALDYCNRTRFVNIYGQSVRLKFLGAVNAYSLPEDELSAGCEVYSATAITPRSVSNVKLVAELGGGRAWRKPLQFMDGEIATLTNLHHAVSGDPEAIGSELSDVAPEKCDCGRKRRCRPLMAFDTTIISVMDASHISGTTELPGSGAV
jgi:hypothetical protein